MAAPVSPSTGDFITKRFWDTEVFDRWTTVYSPWTAYTPVWTSTGTAPALGNGSLVGAYKLLDPATKSIHVRMRLVAQSATTFGTGLWMFTLPAGSVMAALQTLHGFVGTGDGLSRYVVSAYLTTTNGIERIGAAGSTGVTGTSPFTWGVDGATPRIGDQLVLNGTYQIL